MSRASISTRLNLNRIEIGLELRVAFHSPYKYLKNKEKETGIIKTRVCSYHEGDNSNSFDHSKHIPERA